MIWSMADPLAWIDNNRFIYAYGDGGYTTQTIAIYNLQDKTSQILK
jgi:hypothetical protein